MKEGLRIGMIGLDTSHCERFAGLLNDEKNENRVPGGRITVAFPGGSREFSGSINRVEGFTRSMKDDYGIEIVAALEEAVEGVDAVFLESVDGRQHLEQFSRIASYGKPVFIDKPLATSVEDARKIFELSKKHGSPVFSCSSARYRRGIAELKAGGAISGCFAFGPVDILEDYPGYFWYGVHCAEILYSKMGAGCAEVRVHKAGAADVISGRWADGRMGAVYGYRVEGQSVFGCSVFGKEGVETGIGKAGHPSPYAVMLPKIIEFFKTGESPLSAEEMLEIVAFLEAANKSREEEKPVRVQP